MEDLKPAICNLRMAKADVALAIGLKKDEAALKEPTQVFLLILY